MKIIRVSVLLLLLVAAVVAGCKVTDKVTENGPGALVGAGVPEASEKELSTGLDELDDIQALENQEVDVNLTDVDSLQWN